ncbi:MAG: hypothetical protein J1E37_08505 [Prevotella sp.]|nr:hypothetical protein [Prevotella sp.]
MSNKLLTIAVGALKSLGTKQILTQKPVNEAISQILETVLIPMADDAQDSKLPKNVMEVLRANSTVFDLKKITTVVDDLAMTKAIFQDVLSVIEESEIENKEYVLNSFKDIINEL